jgi:hypothetical protein
MKDDNTVLYIVGGLGLLWLITKMSPTAVAAQQAALASTANLQSQQISANQNMANTATIAGAAAGIANALTGNTSYTTSPVYN